MKETAVCRQEKANCISSDILADMLDGTDFSVWSGRDPKKYVWEATLKCKYARLTQNPNRTLLLSPGGSKRMANRSTVSINERSIVSIEELEDDWIRIVTTSEDIYPQRKIAKNSQISIDKTIDCDYTIVIGASGYILKRKKAIDAKQKRRSSLGRALVL